MALQPVCLLYTRSVMESAASEAARLVATNESASDDAIEAFVQRRLAAVPAIEIFHQGGPLDWDIAFTRGGSDGNVNVSIEGLVKPLPVLGAFAGFVGAADEQGCIRLDVEVAYDARPTWLEGSYESWISMWD